MELVAGIAISAVVSWFVVYTAARGAIGDRSAPDGRERHRVELVPVLVGAPVAGRG